MLLMVLVMLSKEFKFLRSNGKAGTGQPKDTKHVVSVSRNNVKAGSEESKGFVTFRHAYKVETS
jgi:hypothetical protein